MYTHVYVLYHVYVPVARRLSAGATGMIGSWVKAAMKGDPHEQYLRCTEEATEARHVLVWLPKGQPLHLQLDYRSLQPQCQQVGCSLSFFAPVTQ